ncbi:hypothetical protein V5O48_004478 [Marasmius crinis-equi]|uniref:Uncharacterized protein n=1 Tax=Marasmius crinis-equi TaxID=585013 RepID=A0ABR3FPZ2_9AGAR
MPPTRSRRLPRTINLLPGTASVNEYYGYRSGWHGRGWMGSLGDIWIHIQMDFFFHTEGQSVKADMTLRQFWAQVIRTLNMNDGFPLPQGLRVGLYDDEGNLIPRTNTQVSSYLDGGDTVVALVFDEENEECVYSPGVGWVYAETDSEEGVA